MALLAIVFRDTTDVWYVDPDLPEHRARWCALDLASDSMRRVCDLRPGDRVLNGGWATMPGLPTVEDFERELGESASRLLRRCCFTVDAVSDGLAHSVLES